MKKDLRSVAKEKNSIPNNPQRNEQVNTQGIREAAKKYEGKSESELLSELKSGFKQGKITPRDVENFSKNAGAMLNDAQRKRLEEIMKQLKE